MLINGYPQEESFIRIPSSIKYRSIWISKNTLLVVKEDDFLLRNRNLRQNTLSIDMVMFRCLRDKLKKEIYDNH